MERILTKTYKKNKQGDNVMTLSGTVTLVADELIYWHGVDQAVLELGWLHMDALSICSWYTNLVGYISTLFQATRAY